MAGITPIGSTGPGSLPPEYIFGQPLRPGAQKEHDRKEQGKKDSKELAGRGKDKGFYGHMTIQASPKTPKIMGGLNG